MLFGEKFQCRSHSRMMKIWPSAYLISSIVGFGVAVAAALIGRDSIWWFVVGVALLNTTLATFILFRLKRVSANS